MNTQINLPGQGDIPPVIEEQESKPAQIKTMLTCIFNKIAENGANQKQSIEESKTTHQNQMQNFAQAVEQKFGESITAIQNLELNANRQEQQNSVIRQGQQGIANEITQSAHGQNYALRIQQEMLDRCQKLEQKLSEMQQNATASSSSNAAPVKNIYRSWTGRAEP